MYSFDSENKRLCLVRLRYDSTVDYPGRRRVVRVAGCYASEMHERANERLVSVGEIVSEIEWRRVSHDDVMILSSEPFD